MMKKRKGFYGSLLLVVPILILLSSGCGKTPHQKVFVLGIDGLTFDLLVPWAQEGKLPHFAQLLERGSSTQLVSTIPPISPPAWTSAVTGVNPGKHGIFGIVKRMQPSGGDRPHLIYYAAWDRMADPVWVLLRERGRRSVVINVPFSSPPDTVKGIMISGLPFTSLTNFTYPPEYRLKIPDYRPEKMGLLAPPLVTPGGEKAYLEDTFEIMNRRAKTVFKLLEEEPWELFFVVFTITDWIQHHFWKFMDPQHPNWEPEKAQLYGDAILKSYQRMDQFLGQLWPRLDAQTTLLIMSDHGFGPVYQPINGESFLQQVMPEGNFQAMAVDNFGAAFNLKVKKGIPYNQKNREALAQFKELLKRELEQLRDPTTGRKVIQQVFEKKDLYWGPYTDRAPDLLGLENRGYLFWNWYSTPDNEVFPHKDDPVFSGLFSGYHLMNGVLLLAGANVRRSTNNFHTQIADIAPTVLYLLGQPVPDEMDGKILTAPISEEYVKSHALDARWARQSGTRELRELPDSSGAINKFIEEQLRAIGYVQ